MSYRQSRPTWPFLCMLACLFVLSATAPRKWEKIGRTHTVARRGRVSAKLKQGELARPAAREMRIEAAGPFSDGEDPFRPGGPSQAAQSPAFIWPDVHEAQSQAISAQPQPEASQDTASSDWRMDRSLETYAAESAAETNEQGVCKLDLSDSTETTSAFANPPTSPDDVSKIRFALRPTRPSTIPRIVVEETDSPPRAPAPESGPDAQAGDWQTPKELVERITLLKDHPETSDWAAQVLGLLDELEAAGGATAHASLPVQARLEEAAAEADRITLDREQEQLAVALRRAQRGLTRRLAVWQQIAMIDEPASETASTPQPQRLLACLSELDALTRTAPEGEGWRRFLLLDGLQLAVSGEAAEVAPRTLAQAVLDRLETAKLSSPQRQFVDSGPLAELSRELRHWAAEPLEPKTLLAHLERYEATGLASEASRVAEQMRRLNWSPRAELQQLARRIDDNYRAANLRVVLSETLLTRLMPPQDPTDEFVRERVLGVSARGHSHTTTDLAVKLVPNGQRLRFILEASGEVLVRASSRTGPATLRNTVHSNYQVQKVFELTSEGLRAESAAADAQTWTQLRAVDTPVRRIPMLGSLVESYVRHVYAEKRPLAERQLRHKISSRVAAQMESEAEARIVQANRQLQANVLAPLRNLSLEPTVASMQTSVDRLTMRLRLACPDQLGAHTPRPRAPSGSLASVQVHESAVNNFIQQLDLSGRTFSQLALHRWVMGKLNRPIEPAPAGLRDDVFLRFAGQDAVCVRAQDGRIELVLAFAELRAEGAVYRDFTIRVFYRPDDENGNVQLARDGVVQLIGNRLGTKAQLALRGIFAKTFSRERRFNILPEKLASDPRMSGVEVSQIVLDDGWLGLALGEGSQKSRVAQRPHATP